MPLPLCTSRAPQMPLHKSPGPLQLLTSQEPLRQQRTQVPPLLRKSWVLLKLSRLRRLMPLVLHKSQQELQWWWWLALRMSQRSPCLHPGGGPSGRSGQR